MAAASLVKDEAELKTAEQRLQTLALEGTVTRQYQLGLFYSKVGKPTDACLWFEKAAKDDEDGAPRAATHANDAVSRQKAQCHLGYAYWSGTGVPRNRDTALQWFLKAAADGDEGSMHAQYFAAVLLEEKKHRPVEAFHVLRRAAQQGHAEAQREVAFRYATGTGGATRAPHLAKVDKDVDGGSFAAAQEALHHWNAFRTCMQRAQRVTDGVAKLWMHRVAEQVRHEAGAAGFEGESTRLLRSAAEEHRNPRAMTVLGKKLLLQQQQPPPQGDEADAAVKEGTALLEEAWKQHHCIQAMEALKRDEVTRLRSKKLFRDLSASLGSPEAAAQLVLRFVPTVQQQQQQLEQKRSADAACLALPPCPPKRVCTVAAPAQAPPADPANAPMNAPMDV